MAATLLWAAGRSLLGRSSLTPCRLIATNPPTFKVREPPQPKLVDRWTEKRALFGVYDNIGILGDFLAHPKNLIKGPKWLRGWKGNELQRCIRKKKMVGDRMFVQDYHNLKKRIKYLYKRFNRTGKHR
ncbi:large ribosomal subunit protein mL51 isoform X1 [Anolis carolinensis]|uniref:large ribosomal subunit protein mL51 isoform X1 n=1 Tax=Anolis carolinensis TaxID=28377 RepID=UPI000203A874|nr:PREDICTED: 39S ribosomal protein L51, mitochondrial [Anolis carolinensis]|eukprot:XP_003226504.1 PREDICTED: 39S ribosomal protein L51, mitochondrial [Anolis carolinensis]